MKRPVQKNFPTGERYQKSVSAKFCLVLVLVKVTSLAKAETTGVSRNAKSSISKIPLFSFIGRVIVAASI